MFSTATHANNSMTVTNGDYVAFLVKPIRQEFPHQRPAVRSCSKLVFSKVSVGSSHVDLRQREMMMMMTTTTMMMEPL